MRHWLGLLALCAGCARTISDFRNGTALNVGQAVINDGTASDLAYWSSTQTMSANWQGMPAEVARFEYNLSSGRDCAGDVSTTQTLDKTQSSITLASLTLREGATYFNCIRAVSSSAIDSDWVVSNGVTIDTTAPSLPATLNVSTTSGQAFLNWTLASDNGSGVQAYEVAYCEPAPCAPPAQPQNTAITSGFVTIAGLTNCQPYSFFVRARDLAGNVSAYSAAAISTPQLSQPIDVQVWSGLGWAEASFPAVSDASDYELCYSLRPSACSSGTTIRTNGQTAFFTNALPQAVGFFAVKAIAGTCASEASADFAVNPFAFSTLFRFDGPYPFLAQAGGTVMTLAGGGDFDGDGVDDLVIGWPNADPSQTIQYQTQGYFQIHSGANGLQIHDPDPSSSLPGNGTASSPFSGAKAVGAAVAFTGDINNDGFDDVLVGSPNQGTAGLADLFYGIADASPAIANTTEYSQGDFTYGAALAAAGDFNHDGHTDYMVAAPQSAHVQLYSGSFAATLLDVTGVPSSNFGKSVSAIGDINGDGFADIAIGAPNETIGSLGSAGAVHLFGGAASGASTTPLYSVVGDGESEEIGAVVAPGGDVDGDGVSDFLVGAPSAPTAGGDKAGRAFVHSGVNGETIWEWDGQVTFDSVGAAMQTMGDVDDDGCSDIAVAAPGQLVDGVIQAGAVYIYSGKTGVLLYRIDQSTLGLSGGTGAALATAGDIDGDGHLDLFVAVPTGNGSAFVLSGATRLGILQAESDDPVGRFGIDKRRTRILAPLATLSLTGSGGTPPYQWTLLTNRSGGTLTPDGHYAAGGNSGVYDQVRVTDSSGQSFDTRLLINSSPMSAVLERPASLVANAAASSVITLGWANRAPSRTSNIIEYRTPVAPWQPLTTTAATTMTFATPSLLPHTTYFFRIKAANAVTDSEWSNRAMATTD